MCYVCCCCILLSCVCAHIDRVARADLERPSGEAVREAWAGQGDHRACHGGADPRAAAPRLGGRPRPTLAPAAVRRVARPLQPPGPAAQYRQPARATLRGRRAQLPRPRRARRQRLLRQHHRGACAPSQLTLASYLASTYGR
jgi:hypothetical protein